MNAYILQKTQQALEALTKELPLKDRLVEASCHLNIVSEGNHFVTMPPEVRKAFHNYLSAVQSGDDEAMQLRILIEEVFRHSGPN